MTQKDADKQKNKPNGTLWFFGGMVPLVYLIWPTAYTPTAYSMSEIIKIIIFFPMIVYSFIYFCAGIIRFDDMAKQCGSIFYLGWLSGSSVLFYFIIGLLFF